MRLNEIMDLVHQFENQNRDNPLETDEQLIKDARQRMEAYIGNHGHTTEVVHLAFNIYGNFGLEGLVHRENLLKKYLTTSISNDERTWGNWNLVDTLALERKYKETIDQQQRFFAWTESNLGLDECLYVMCDATQALAWMIEGRFDDWLAIYRRLLNEVKPSEAK